MKNLFVIDGAAGTGKSDLLKYITREKPEFGIITKFTTRNKRDEEEANDYILDLEFIKKDEFENLKKNTKAFYHYGYGDKQYGFLKSDLEEKLSLHGNVFIIIRNNDLPKKLKKDFPDVRIIFVYIYSDRDKIEERLKKAGYTDDKIQYRLERNEIAWNDYRRNSKDYDEVLINNSDTIHYETLIEQLIAKYNQPKNDSLEISNRAIFPLIKPLSGYKDEILNKVEQYPYEKNVFLMMRYRDYNEHLYERIKNLIEISGKYKCVRANMPEWNITNNVYNPIAVLYTCKYGIVLFDKPDETETNEYNPNVAYELGMMHLQKKDCLILKHTSLNNLPFDIIKDLYNPYTNPKDMDKCIEDWIKTTLK